MLLLIVVKKGFFIRTSVVKRSLLSKNFKCNAALFDYVWSAFSSITYSTQKFDIQEVQHSKKNNF